MAHLIFGHSWTFVYKFVTIFFAQCQVIYTVHNFHCLMSSIKKKKLFLRFVISPSAPIRTVSMIRSDSLSQDGLVKRQNHQQVICS